MSRSVTRQIQIWNVYLWYFLSTRKGYGTWCSWRQTQQTGTHCSYYSNYSTALLHTACRSREQYRRKASHHVDMRAIAAVAIGREPSALLVLVRVRGGGIGIVEEWIVQVEREWFFSAEKREWRSVRWTSVLVWCVDVVEWGEVYN